MKAITIIQPWATLIALGEKKVETRSWKTSYRGEIAIHAGKKVDKTICRQEPFRSILKKHGYTADNLPMGSVIAKCNLVDCCEISYDRESMTTHLMDESLTKVDGNELEFGDYTDGRYGWKLSDVKFLDTPVPTKGKLSLWEWSE